MNPINELRTWLDDDGTPRTKSEFKPSATPCNLRLLTICYPVKSREAREQWAAIYSRQSAPPTRKSIMETIIRARVQHYQALRRGDLIAVSSVHDELVRLSNELDEISKKSLPAKEAQINSDPGHPPVFINAETVIKPEKRVIRRVWRRRIEKFLFDSVITWLVIAVIEGWIK